jgi:hypothetical protein
VRRTPARRIRAVLGRNPEHSQSGPDGRSGPADLGDLERTGERRRSEDEKRRGERGRPDRPQPIIPSCA